MSIKNFKEEEIPFEKLGKVGLTRQMIEDLPEEDLGKILRGQLSPLLPISFVSQNGQTYNGKGRFSVYVKQDGSISAKIHPVMQPIGKTMQVAKLDEATGGLQYSIIQTSERYTQQVIDQLKSGKVVLDYLYKADGTKEQAYLQLDDETNAIIGSPAEEIKGNLGVVITELRLTNTEENSLRHGQTVSYSKNDEDMLTVGLDLQSPSGIHFAVGDEKAWQESRKRDWDKYELGVNGCWMTDDDGNLSYIPEEDFEEQDIWAEIEKQNERKKNADISHRGLSK